MSARGVGYLIARAAQDGRVAGTLRAIALYARRGDVVLEEQARRDLDALIFRWYDAAASPPTPMYRNSDVRRASEELARRERKED